MGYLQCLYVLSQSVSSPTELITSSKVLVKQVLLYDYWLFSELMIFCEARTRGSQSRISTSSSFLNCISELLQAIQGCLPKWYQFLYHSSCQPCTVSQSVNFICQFFDFINQHNSCDAATQGKLLPQQTWNYGPSSSTAPVGSPA